MRLRDFLESGITIEGYRKYECWEDGETPTIYHEGYEDAGLEAYMDREVVHIHPYTSGPNLPAICIELAAECKAKGKGPEEGIKTWYCVTSTYDDRGRIAANITDTVEAEEKPKDTCVSTSRKDIYNNWFASPEEATAYVEQCRRA